MAGYLRGLPTTVFIRNKIHLGAIRAELVVIPSVFRRRALGANLFLGRALGTDFFLEQRYVAWYLFSGNLFATLTASASFVLRRVVCIRRGGVIEVGYRRIRYPVGSREN